MQQIVRTSDGVIRFRENKVVSWLLENGGIDMNRIAIQGFDADDREQFAQLIGYSVSGFGDLSYASDEVYDTAAELADALRNK